MDRKEQIEDFKKEVETLKNTADAEEYARQLAHLFLGNGLSLKTILLMAIDFGRQHPNWVPVGDELPKENEEVLAYNSLYNEKYLCVYHNGKFEDYLGELGKGAVSHWMEIQPPRKEGKQ